MASEMASANRPGGSFPKSQNPFCWVAKIKKNNVGLVGRTRATMKEGERGEAKKHFTHSYFAANKRHVFRVVLLLAAFVIAKLRLDRLPGWGYGARLTGRCSCLKVRLAQQLLRIELQRASPVRTEMSVSQLWRTLWRYRYQLGGRLHVGRVIGCRRSYWRMAICSSLSAVVLNAYTSGIQGELCCKSYSA
jgi:hypothetical protein